VFGDDYPTGGRDLHSRLRACPRIWPSAHLLAVEGVWIRGPWCGNLGNGAGAFGAAGDRVRWRRVSGLKVPFRVVWDAGPGDAACSGGLLTTGRKQAGWRPVAWRSGTISSGRRSHGGRPHPDGYGNLIRPGVVFIPLGMIHRVGVLVCAGGLVTFGRRCGTATRSCSPTPETYLSQAIHHYAGWDRPIFYSLFMLAVTCDGYTLAGCRSRRRWLTAWVLRLVVRVLVPGASGIAFRRRRRRACRACTLAARGWPAS